MKRICKTCKYPKPCYRCANYDGAPLPYWEPKKEWRVVYENDTGYNDDGFWEWWIITDGDRSFKTDSQQDAAWLLDILRKL